MGAKERTHVLLEHTYEMMQEASLAKSYQQRAIEIKLLLRYVMRTRFFALSYTD